MDANFIEEVTAVDESNARNPGAAPLSDLTSENDVDRARNAGAALLSAVQTRNSGAALLSAVVKEKHIRNSGGSLLSTAIEEEKSSAPAIAGSVEPWESTLTRRRPKPPRSLSHASSVDSINVLNTIEPEGLNGVSEKQQEWIEVVFAVDSGATETVMREEMLEEIETVEGRAFKRGVKYEVANGVRIDNLGEKRFTGVTTEGSQRNITAQICEVNKALLSVRKVVSAGNKVVFDDVSYIEDKNTGEPIMMEDQGGMYVFKMWVQDESF